LSCSPRPTHPCLPFLLTSASSPPPRPPSALTTPRRPLFLLPTPLSLLLFSPISFQRLSRPKLPPPRSINSQDQRRQEELSPQAAAAVDLALLPRNLRDIVSLFRSVSDPKAKYQKLLHYGGRLPPLDPRYKTEEHRVRGCVSQVWVRAFSDPADAAAVRFEAGSDSVLTKGLAALLVLGLSGSPALAIARVPADFVHLLGLRLSLTPSRNNGFLNVLKLMRHKALQLMAGNTEVGGVLDDKGSILGETGGKDSAMDITSVEKDSLLGERGGEGSRGDSVASDVSDGEGVNFGLKGDPPSGSGGGSGSRAARIRERLEGQLRPAALELEDVSYQHAGHAGIRGNNSGETHFNVRIVSEEFEGKSLVKRHRLVYDLLQEELQTGLHALSIVAKTPSEVGMK
ncbi:hypothetical protein Taro_026394, partial [Colocasia esculenta]|nr:hypothetical protein [Colocasia esculenta]